MTTMLESPQRMECMEVWGGNVAAEKALAMPGLRVWFSSKPFEKSEGGGDVYYISACASGRITRFLLADISGHGEDASAMATTMRDLMRENVNVVKQRRFVRAMNRKVAELSEASRFATVLVCTHFSPTGSLQWTNAGHPPPFWYHAETGEWSILARDDATAPTTGKEPPADTPLGTDAGTDFAVTKIMLRPSDLVVCYSDAFTKSVDQAGQTLGADGLLDIVREIDADRPDQLIERIRARITQLNSANLTTDDATMAVLQSVPGRTTIKDNLMAALRVLRPVRDATQFRTPQPPP